MIKIYLKGGMGNQMFQYALGRVLSMKNKVPLVLDTSFYDLDLKPKREYDLDVFNLFSDLKIEKKLNIFKRFLFGMSGKVIKEKFFHFDSEIFKIGDNAILEGYWQSPKYFEGYEDIIKKDFSFKKDFSLEIQNLAKEIKDKKSLCVHVRRGDFVGNTFHDVLDKDFYKKAFDILKEKVKIDKVYIFSDDIDWCRNNMNFPIPTVFVGNEYSGEKGEGNLFLMSLCKYFIIPNSTFSWWGAWLSGSSMVVCPKKWFADESINTNDLIPEKWIRI
ncbi:MAG: alpha-1,2-fucosyltransferase [Candidatus Pacebacteria bacterium]|nr:alpha-1,2-fucosyltransferase [Candidatus Paceibacterota bacterium]MCF7862616.1 alpha-1,2-fucosyltransferase [Candidatus Paceibacterota bacterium]